MGFAPSKPFPLAGQDSYRALVHVVRKTLAALHTESVSNSGGLSGLLVRAEVSGALGGDVLHSALGRMGFAWNPDRSRRKRNEEPESDGHTFIHVTRL